MIPLNILGAYKWVVYLVALAAVVAGVWALEAHVEQIGYDRAETKYKSAIAEQKAEAASTLASETAKANAKTAELQDFKNQQELKDATHQKTVNDLSDRLRLAAGPAGRLRDPNAGGCRGGGGGAQAKDPAGANDSANNASQAGGLLSAELTGLLDRILKESDDINVAYASCRADAFKVRE